MCLFSTRVGDPRKKFEENVRTRLPRCVSTRVVIVECIANGAAMFMLRICDDAVHCISRLCCRRTVRNEIIGELFRSNLKGAIISKRAD